MDDPRQARQARVAPTPAKPKNCHHERSRGTCSFSIVRESLTRGPPFPRSVRKGGTRGTKRNGPSPMKCPKFARPEIMCLDGHNLRYPKGVSQTAFSTNITAPIDYRGCSTCALLLWEEHRFLTPL